MIKKILFMVVFLIIVPGNVFAYNIFHSEGMLSSNLLSYRSSSMVGDGHDTIYIELSNHNVQEFFVQSYGVDSSFTNKGSYTGRTARELGVNKIDWLELTCNHHYEVTLYDEYKTTIGFMQIFIDDLQNPRCNSGGDGSNDDGNEGDCGCVFNTPGWQEYMGKIDEIIDSIPSPIDYTSKLDEIIDSIPPAPDWNRVSQIITGDMRNMLGYAPDLPSQPNAPSGLDDGGLKKPTGQDSGLKGFDDNDIKSGSKEIPVNEDPTGGWDILDPLESMPEQEIFIPEEGDLTPPEVPDVEGIAPTPKEPENPVPSNPSEPGGTAPIPGEPEGTAPTPSEPGGTAPMPGEQDNTAPTPSEPGNQAPIPGENNAGFPMPGGDSNQAPIPGQNTYNAPIPGQGGG